MGMIGGLQPNEKPPVIPVALFAIRIAIPINPSGFAGEQLDKTTVQMCNGDSG